MQPAQRRTSIAVLMTCHNRVSHTLRCLSHLYDQKLDAAVSITVYLVDDGSTDGTGDAVKSRHPDVQVLEGDGTLFWNRGMHRAFSKALESGHDYYLWLNDDTYLHPDAMQILLSTHDALSAEGKVASILVASTKDSETGEFSYGGYLREPGFLNPLRFRMIPPQSKPIRCATMCGNCVLIPAAVAGAVGNIDPSFRHRWGDVDYGLRAGEKGCEVWIAPGILADCDANPNEDRWRNPGLPLKERIKELHSLKGLGKQDWLRFTRVHGGAVWPWVWVKPYLRIAYDTLR